MFGIRRKGKKDLGKISFSKILDEILDELLIAKEERNGLRERIRDIEKKYSEKTGFKIRIEASGDLATIWINDLQFDYELRDAEDMESGETEWAEMGSRDVMYI